MKIVKPVWFMVFTMVMLAACNKKESEDNKPVPVVPEEIIEPNPDQIRKVIRYDNAGVVQDSVFFRYDTKNRIAKIEYGDFVNGQYENVVEYQYSKDPNGQDVISEKNLQLDNAGQYAQVFSVTYSGNNAFNKASGIKTYVNGSLRRTFSCKYDNVGFLESILAVGSIKMGDFFLDFNAESQHNNRIKARIDSDVMGSHEYSFEYYPQPYNHNLFTYIYDIRDYHFWNRGMENPFEFRNSFLGNRNQNLLKKMRITNSNLPPVEMAYEYEFNHLGLVSSVNTATISANGVTPPMTTKYEIFYY